MKRTLLAFALLLSLSVTHADGGSLLTPNGNPTGVVTAKGTGGSATLDPSPAFEETQPQVGPLRTDNLLLMALDKQGFNAKNGYTITFAPLFGNDITLGTYTAWADSRPTVTSGAITAGGDVDSKGKPLSFKGFGGAAIGLNYDGSKDKSNKDPVANTHWVSVLEDNQPLKFEKDHGTNDPLRPGFTLSIDNPFAPRDKNGNPTTPFYDAGGAANGTDFVDLPSDSLNSGARLIFHTYIVMQDPADARKLTFYDDVAWGVRFTPEPGSVVLLSMGAGGVICYGRRRAKK